MVVCKFFQQGNCKFGARCGYEHPRESKAAGSFGNTSKTNNSYSLFNGRTNPPSEQAHVPDITADLIKADLGSERPQWPFTSYCPVKYGTANLIQDQDLSFEEVRASAYEALQNGTMPSYEQQLGQKAGHVTEQVQSILGNLSQAVQVSQDKNRPGKGQTTSTFGQNKSQTSQNAFASNNSSAANPFQTSSSLGVSSVFGQAQQGSSVFGQAASKPAQGSAFGQPQNSNNTAFGQSNNPTSVFGQSSSPASVFGQSNGPTSVFGQASSPLTTFGQATKPIGQSPGLGGSAASSSSAFGQPSAFGQASQPQSAFGQPSQPQSSFGQSAPSQSAFGQPSQPTSVFGQATQPNNAFGQPSQPASAFGQPAQPASAFGGGTNGAKSAFGSTLQSSSPFGQAQQSQSAFQTGQATNTALGGSGNASSTNGPFGQQASSTAPLGKATSAFGQSAPQSAFGQPSLPLSSLNTNTQAPAGAGQTVSQAQAIGAPQTTSSVFGNASSSSPFGAPNNNSSAFGSSSQTHATSFAKPDSSQPQGGNSAFGGSAFGSVKTTQDHSGQLSGSTGHQELEVADLPEEFLVQYRAEQFTLGQIPEVPPPRSLVV